MTRKKERKKERKRKNNKLTQASRKKQTNAKIQFIS
jgi:hypothetical protein